MDGARGRPAAQSDSSTCGLGEGLYRRCEEMQGELEFVAATAGFLRDSEGLRFRARISRTSRVAERNNLERLRSERSQLSCQSPFT